MSEALPQETPEIDCLRDFRLLQNLGGLVIGLSQQLETAQESIALLNQGFILLPEGLTIAVRPNSVSREAVLHIEKRFTHMNEASSFERWEQLSPQASAYRRAVSDPTNHVFYGRGIEYDPLYGRIWVYKGPRKDLRVLVEADTEYKVKRRER